MAYTTINKSTEHFNTKTYTGNGSTQAITGLGFQPDFVWTKPRVLGGHFLSDSIRGGTQILQSGETNAEATRSNHIQSFDTDGYTLGADGTSNSNGDATVSWNWLASNTTASNTDGSINSTVSVNTTAGFSIVKFTGTGANGTVGHGLNAVPKFIFGKNRYSATSAWPVYSSVLGGTKYLNINTSSGEGTYSGYWNNTDPTSSVISLGSHGDVNTDGHSHIYYCFAEKQGFSKFGYFVGNGNNDGTFVYTGFKPSFILLKNTSVSSSWLINDNKRPGYNANSQTLVPNNNEAENTGTDRTDFLSNGFKLRVGASTAWNGNGNTIIYMAFAEAPLVGSNNIPCTAR